MDTWILISANASKGEQTRALILDQAIRHAAVHGFEALTIGGLADQTLAIVGERDDRGEHVQGDGGDEGGAEHGDGDRAGPA